MTFRLRVALLGLLAFAAPLAVYVFSLHHGVDYWDTGELQTVPYILGIPHPSGFPAYVIFGWVWVHTLAFADPATLMNLFSAIGMSIAAFALFAFLTELGIEPFFALGSAVVFGCTRVPWDHATRADVHAVALAAATLAFWFALRWSRTGSVRVLITCAITAACALAIHSGMILVVPGIALVALGRRPSLRTATATLALGALIVAAFYAYLPLRSAVVTTQHLDPTLTLGVTAGRPFWDNDHPSTFDGFRKEVGGGEFGATHALRTIFDPHVVSGLYERYGRSAIGDLAGGVVVIALFGVVAMMRRSVWTACGLLIGGFMPVLFVLAYTAESDPERYFLPSYWAIGVMLGAGAQWLSRGGMQHTARGVVLLVGTLFLFVAASNVYANRGAFFGGSSEAQRFIDRVRTNTPDNAVLVAAWMYATPLAYGAYVQHSLGNRIVLTGWPEDYTKAEYRRWLAKRPVIVLTDEDLLQLPGFDLRERDALLGPTIFTMTSKP